MGLERERESGGVGERGNESGGTGERSMFGF